MHRLIYMSHAAVPVADDTLAALLQQARLRNQAQGITGVLFQGPEQFVQVLEGSAIALDDLYGRLQRDSRHHSVIQLSYKRTARRHFAQWSMAYYAGAPAQAAPLWGYPTPDRLGQCLAALSRTEGSLFQVLLGTVRAPVAGVR
ncbi:MAG: hypothetical protein NVS3B25_04220 [Hymenobacter sp.]